MAFKPVGIDDNGLLPIRALNALRKLFFQKGGDAGIYAKSNGVVGDGVTDDSTAINALITSVSNSGGGTIVFAPAVYSIANPIILKQGVFLVSHAANHGYASGSALFAATPAIPAGSYVVDTIAGGIATAGGVGIDVRGNAVCGGVRISRIAWGVWSKSFITNCGGSGLWEGGGFADAFEDLLITNSLLTVPTSVKGAFDIGNTVDTILGTDHYVTRCEFAARGTNDSLTSSNMYAAAAAIRGSNHFLNDSVAETSDVGWYLAAEKTSYSHIRADTNKGHGFWLVKGTSILTGCRSIGNSQAGSNLYDGFYIESGAWANKILNAAVFVAGSIKPRYGFNSSVSGGDPVYALQLVNPTVEDAGTARYNLNGYFGVVFPSVALSPSATATPDVHETSGPISVSGWAATTITNFVGGVDGQTISIVGSTSVSVANNATIVTSTGAQKALTNSVHRFTRKGGVWYEDAISAGSGGAAVGLGAAFYHFGNQSVPANAVTQVTLGSTDFNDDSTNGYVLANNAVTVKKSGLYMVTWFGDAGSEGGAGGRSFFAQVNGTTIGEASTYTTGVEVRLTGSRVMRITAGSTVSLACYVQNALNVYGASAKDTGISLAYLGS